MKKKNGKNVGDATKEYIEAIRNRLDFWDEDGYVLYDEEEPVYLHHADGESDILCAVVDTGISVEDPSDDSGIKHVKWCDLDDKDISFILDVVETAYKKGYVEEEIIEDEFEN